VGGKRTMLLVSSYTTLKMRSEWPDMDSFGRRPTIFCTPVRAPGGDFPGALDEDEDDPSDKLAAVGVIEPVGRAFRHRI